VVEVTRDVTEREYQFVLVDATSDVDAEIKAEDDANWVDHCDPLSSDILDTKLVSCKVLPVDSDSWNWLPENWQ